jgi:hypothetical protein
MRIGPDAKVSVGNTASALNRRSFGKHNPRPTLGKLSEMHHMPVIRDSVAGTVLTHRRDRHPVRDGKIANL